jgi:hypothetical protein
VLPNGDVLVAESNAPPKPEDGKGLKGMIMKLVMKRAGAGVPSANRITCCATPMATAWPNCAACSPKA